MVFILLIAIAILSVTIKNALNGVGTIEVERARRWNKNIKKGEDDYDPRLRLWVPFLDKSRAQSGAVVIVDPAIALFDLGKQRNWEQFLGSDWTEWLGKYSRL